MQVTALPRRSARAGAELALLVLAAGPPGCIAVDVASGALVRATSAEPWSDVPDPYDLVVSTQADPADLVFDPAEPEAVLLATPPERVRRLPGWRADRLLRALRHPRHGQLLGWGGPAVKFWMLDGSHPSAAILDVEGGPVAFRRPQSAGHGDALRCRFSWSGRTLELPLADNRVAAALGAVGRPSLSGSALAAAAGGRPRYLLVALTPPHEGTCHKVVAGILPRPR